MFAARRLATVSSHFASLSAPRVTATTSLAATRPRTFTPTSTAKVGSSFSTAASPEAMSDAKTLVDNAIKDNDVLVFSKSYCPYCKRAKAILEEITPDVKVYELDEMDDGSVIQQYLKSLNGQGTVPHVYIKQHFIGGCSDLQAIPKNQLVKQIKG